MYSNHALAPGLKTAPEGEAGSIARRLWPQGIPGSVQFPNIAQVNQLWTVSLEEEGKKQKFLTGSAALTFNDKAQEIDDEETRKQKNRVFAKRSREKRKNQCQQLESEVNALLKQNQDLRNLVQAHIPNKAQSIIKDCCKNHPIHQAAAAAAAAAAAHSDPKDRQKNLDGSDFMLIENLIHSQQSFVLTDPFQADNPIVYASEAFYKLTGYSSDKILGRNCRILQGPDTDLKAVQQIRYNIEQGKDTSVNLLNYKADGTPFWNQFFVAPLRNRDRVIVNYVGVQCEIEAPGEKYDDGNDDVDHPEEENCQSENKVKLTPRKNSSTIRIQGPPDITSMIQNPKPLKKVIVSNVPTFDPLMDMEMQPVASTTTQVLDQLLTQPLPNTAKPEAVCSEHSPTITDKVQDWSILAQVLQEDFEGHDNFDFDQEFDESSSTNAGSSFFTEAADDWEKHEHDDEPYLKCFTKSPLSFVTRTCRSELVDSLLAAQGDVTDGRFVKALEVLSSIYAASNHKTDPEIFISKFLNGSWVSLSKPAYGGCLGKNQQGDYLYTLGKLSFGMFKPANLKCSVHHTLNNIRHACEIDTAPTAAPWSLRRELALMDPDNPGKPTFKPQASTLRNYDIEIALTIEPESIESTTNSQGPSSSRRLRALQVVHGYMLQDPDVKNRLTVWFTGGKLLPSKPPKEQEYGSFEDWKQTFDSADQTSTWGESLKNMGAKLLLGAEFPQGMELDGSMAYTLHRPYGGHGKGFVDILYLDEDMYITKGNYGSIHVCVHSRLLSNGMDTAKVEFSQKNVPPTLDSNETVAIRNDHSEKLKLGADFTAQHDISRDSKEDRNVGEKKGFPTKKSQKLDSEQNLNVRWTGLSGVKTGNYVFSSGATRGPLLQGNKPTSPNALIKDASKCSVDQKHGAKRKADSISRNENVEALRREDTGGHWKSALNQDLQKKGPESIMQEMNAILLSYGLEVSRKKQKCNDKK